MNGGYTETQDLTGNFFRRVILVVICFTLAGAPAMMIQGIAWIDMAQEMGGMDNLSTAIFESEPCELCVAAGRLGTAENSPTNPSAPVKSEAFKLIARVAEEMALEDSEEMQRGEFDRFRTSAASFVVIEHEGSLPTPPPRSV